MVIFLDFANFFLNFLLAAGIQIVGMSATIGNLNEIAQFLNADVYTRNFRPVELEEFIKCGSDILKINTKAECLEDAFTYERTVSFKVKKFLWNSNNVAV